MDTAPFSFRFFPHGDHRGTLGRVPCAVQQVLLGQSFLHHGVHVPVPNPSPSRWEGRLYGCVPLLKLIKSYTLNTCRLLYVH